MKSERRQSIAAILEVDGVKYPLTKSLNGEKHLEPILGRPKADSGANLLFNDIYDQSRTDHIEVPDASPKKKHVNPHKARKAFREMTSLPHVFRDPVAAWHLFLLCLLVRVVAIAIPWLQGVPTVILDNVDWFPDYLGRTLTVMNDDEHLKGKRINIKRPNVVKPIVPVGSWAPSGNPEDYLGGWVKFGYTGKKRHLWLPVCHRVVAIAPSTPAVIAKLVINSSPLVIPILCPSMVKLSDRPTIHLDGTGLLSADEAQLAQVEKFRPVIQAEIKVFVEWLTAKERRIEAWKGAVSKYYPSARDGRFTTISKGNVQTDIAAAGLALLECFLSFASEKMGWISSEKANHVLQDAWSAVLPETAPNSVNGGGNNPNWASCQTFWSFLTTYISEHAVGLSADGAPVEQEIVGVLHRLSDVPYLIFPRSVLLQAYVSWLKDQSAGTPEQGGRWVTTMQKVIMNWGVPIRTEGEDISWRFAFYRKGQAPAGLKEKLPCLAFPIAQLPPEVITALESALGSAFTPWNPDLGHESEVAADG